MDTVFTHFRDPSPLPVELLDEAGYETALARSQRILDAAPVAPLDAVIHGVGVRLHTDNAFWRQMWSANWFAPDSWTTLTGQSPPTEPRIHLYAVAPEGQVAPQVSYSRQQNTAFLFGDMVYGPLRALAREAVARMLAEEEAVHFVPCMCSLDDKVGTLLLSPPNLQAAIAIPPLLDKEDVHLIAWDGVFIRYGLVRMVDGVTLLPKLVIDEKGNRIPGYRLFSWLDEYGYWEPRADARCLTLNGEEEYCFARDLDLARPPEAFAFPFEKEWYLPTQVVVAQPSLAGPLCRGLLENVPPLTSELLDRFGGWARQATSSLLMATDPPTRSLVKEMGQEQLMEALCRLRAAPHSRAMVSPEQLLPWRAGGHPGQALQIQRVALMGSDAPIFLGPPDLSEHLRGTTSQLSMGDTDEIARTLTNLLERAIGPYAS
jgi:hypothetical protein